MSEDSNPVVTLKVRVTPEFREKIVVTAKENNRSMNQEIVARLEESFSSQPMLNSELAESLINLQLELKTNKAIQDELMKTQQMLIDLLNNKKIT